MKSKFRYITFLSSHRSSVLALSAAIASSPLASGVDLYWNETSTTWNTSTATWNTAADNTGTTQAWTNGDSAVFSATNVAGAGPTTLTNGGVTVDNITLATGRRIQVSNNTITLADTNMVIDVQQRISGDYDLRLNSVIADSVGGASAITKNGAGILMLTGANTFSGGFTLNAGTVAIESSANAFGSGTLTLNGGNLAKSWGSGLTLANAINVTGSTNVGIVQGSANNLIFSGTWAAGNTNGAFNVGNTALNGLAVQSATIFVSGDVSAYTGTFAHNNLASGGNRLRFGPTSGSGTITFDASNAKFLTSGSTTGNNVIDLADNYDGTFRMGELAGTGGRVRAGWSTGGNTTFEVGALGTHSKFAGRLDDNPRNLTGLSALNKVGTGTLELALANGNGYSAGTTVTNGRLLANNTTGSATGTGAVTVNGVGARLAGTGIIAPTGTNGINVTTGFIAPGGTVSATTGGSYSDTVGTLSFNLGGTTGTIVMGSDTGFEFGLGAAGATIDAVGSGDLITLLSATASDFTFNSNSINFGGTGELGFYKLFDTDLDATTWSGLTYDGTSGEITDGLTYTNLASGLSGKLIVGGLSSGGDVGDIYFQVIPEPGAAFLGGIGLLALLRRRRD